MPCKVNFAFWQKFFEIFLGNFMEYKVPELYSSSTVLSLNRNLANNLETMSLNSFLDSFPDDDEVISSEYIKQFNYICTIQSVETDIEPENSYFPRALIRSISILLTNPNLDDSTLRPYILAISKLSSLSESYSFALIDLGILNLFIQIVCSNLTMSRAHAFVTINNMIVSENVIKHIDENSDFLAHLIALISDFGGKGDFNLPLRILSKLCEFRTSLPIMESACSLFSENIKHGNQVAQVDAAVGLAHLITNYPEAIEQAIELDVIDHAFNFLTAFNINTVKSGLSILLVISQTDFWGLVDIDILCSKLVCIIRPNSDISIEALNFILALIRNNNIHLNIFLNENLVQEICRYSNGQKFVIRNLCTQIICEALLFQNEEIRSMFLANNSFNYIISMIDETNEQLSSMILNAIEKLFLEIPNFEGYKDCSDFVDIISDYSESDSDGYEIAERILAIISDDSSN